MNNNNESQKDQESKPIKINNVDRRYSVKVNSSKEISDKLHANYIQRQSPIQSLPMFNLNFQKDEKNSANNHKMIPTYSPLTPQLIPKDQKFLNRKFFPSKEDVCRGNPEINQKKSIPSSSPLTQYFNIDMGFFLLKIIILAIFLIHKVKLVMAKVICLIFLLHYFLIREL